MSANTAEVQASYVAQKSMCVRGCDKSPDRAPGGSPHLPLRMQVAQNRDIRCRPERRPQPSALDQSASAPSAVAPVATSCLIDVSTRRAESALRCAMESDTSRRGPRRGRGGLQGGDPRRMSIRKAHYFRRQRIKRSRRPPDIRYTSHAYLAGFVRAQEHPLSSQSFQVP